MKIQQLRYVSMVEKYGSITQAAQKLYVSQPSVSAAIRSLEEELGIEIFHRTAKGIVITEEGRELVKMSNKILHDVDYVSDFFKADEKDEKATFYVSSQHYDFVAKAFEQFTTDSSADQYSFGLIYGQTATILEDVRKQYSNLGVIFMSDVNRVHMQKALADRHLAFHSIGKTHPHVFLAKDHPLADRASIKAEELLPYPCICFEQDTEDPEFFSESMVLSDFYPPKILYINDLSSSINLIRECQAYDIGTGIMTERLNEELCVVPVESPEVVEIGWIGLKGKTLSPIEKKFIQLLRKQIKDGLQSE